MSDGLIVRVDTGRKSEYVFRQSHGSYVSVDIGEQHYHDFDAKGKTAVLMLMKDHERLRQFFVAASKLSMLSLPGDKFDGFVDRGLVDEDTEEAWELVAQMMEEAFLAEERA